MSNPWIELEQKYYMPTFSRLPVVLVRGEGVRVWDDSGKAYLDMVGGIAVNVLGHCHPAVVSAIRNQAGTLMHTSNLYYTKPQLELARALVEQTRTSKVFFANSGAEANEGAIKLARKYGRVNRGGAYEVISCLGSFHGRTLATIAATGQEKFHKPFEPMPAGFVNVPFNDIEAVKAATTDKTCAVLVECIQGESGVHPAQQAFIKGLRQWCNSNDLLLMMDEIQTGLGRTGTFLAAEHYGVQPDVVTLAKGLAGGVPIGAVLATDRASVFTVSDHGSTFGGNPLACSAGLATVTTIVKDGLIDCARVRGQQLLEGFRGIQERQSCITAVRGIGLMAAVDLATEDAPRVVAAALERGLILNNTGPKTLRLVPPLIVSEAEISEALSIIEESLRAL